MASQQLDVQMYQNLQSISASIKADFPHARQFTAHIAENGFIVSADG